MLDEYKIDLKGMRTDATRFGFVLEEPFFSEVDAPEVRKGKVEVNLTVRKKLQLFELDFHLEGIVIVSCDLCLDDMEQEVRSDNCVRVKFGDHYSEEADDLIIIPEEDGTINVAWLMYEFIALSIPMKHVHPDGLCNETMSSRLNSYLRETVDGEEGVAHCRGDETPMDPRWSELKKLLDNN